MELECGGVACGEMEQSVSRFLDHLILLLAAKEISSDALLFVSLTRLAIDSLTTSLLSLCLATTDSC